MTLSLFNLILLFLSGILGGFLAGLLGIGGGIIYVGVISYYFNSIGIEGTELVKYIIANSLCTTLFAGLTATFKQIQHKHYYFREIINTAIPGIISALFVTFLLIQFNWYTEKLFSIFFILILFFFSWRLFFFKRKTSLQGIKGKLKAGQFAFSGFLAGILSALSGLGGGILLIPFMTGVYRLNIKKASLISLGMIPFFAILVSLYYAFSNPIQTTGLQMTYGYISFILVLPLAAGVIISTPLGMKLARKLTQKTIRIIFAIVLLVITVNMIRMGF